MSQPIVFIHGMFMNPLSWGNWTSFFAERGYSCHAPPWPYHDGAPSELRADPDSRLGTLTLGEVVSTLRDFVGTLDGKPVLVGHSMGGLVVQKLMATGLGTAGVCIDSAPPKGVVSFEPSFLKANVPVINPLKGNRPCLLTVEEFHYAFCNTMTDEETRAAYDEFVVPESRNVARSSSGADGAIDLRQPHAPLLFIAGEHDHIIPASLNRKNHAAYRDAESQCDFKEFEGRSHFICGQRGWQEVAEYVGGWLDAL